MPRNAFPRLLSSFVLIPSAWLIPHAGANPSGGEIVAGAADISQAGSTLTVTQHSHRAVINWDSFSIGAGELTKFVQPSASSAVLNRVTGGDISTIYGTLSANGQVWLLNPNGILVGTSGVIDTAGFLASTANVADSAFLAGGDLTFTPPAGDAEIVNLGRVSALAGDVVLIARQVRNAAGGELSAPAGSVAIAATGGEVLLKSMGAERLFIQPSSAAGALDNAGRIEAATAELRAAGGNEYALAINNTGVVRATGVVNEGGRILLRATNGTVRNSGTLSAEAAAFSDASAATPEVHVLGRRVELADSSRIEAAGGFVDTSGETVSIADGARVDTRTADGRFGTWLIDPTDFYVTAGGSAKTDSGIGADTLAANLQANHITLATVAASGEAGDIHVNADVSWSADTTLTLTAHNDIFINALITATGDEAGLALNHGAGRDYYLGNGGRVTLSGANSAFSVNGDAYTVIRDVDQLQQMNTALGERYVLGVDIDASATAGWNGGLGFSPVGDNSTNNNASWFSGTFDGLGHVISGLTINRPAQDNVGLFGVATGTTKIRNVGLVGGSVSGYHNVGGLVGRNSGNIERSYTTGTVSAGADSIAVGGLVGWGGGNIEQSYATGTVSAGAGSIAVGGLVGHLLNIIEQSYATGAVSGSQYVGGLVGLVDAGDIKQSYATGAVSGDVLAGGLVGRRIGGVTVTNSYWATDTTGRNTSAGGTGMPLAQLIAAMPAGFDATVWGNVDNQTTPYLLNLSGNRVHVANGGANLYSLIHTLEELQAIENDLGGFYALANNIDASATAGWDGGLGFSPIGDPGLPSFGIPETPFTGTFDGLGHVISGLTINRPAENYVGLFGYVGASGRIRNVGVEDVHIEGAGWTGALVSLNDGQLAQTYATGVVSAGHYYSGGLVGLNDGTVADSYASVDITGRNETGGLAGRNSGLIIRSYATGDVNGSYYVGGLVGVSDNGGSIVQSYATGSAEAGFGVGGLVGANHGSITLSYATGSAKGGYSIGGLAGLNQSSGNITRSYATGEVSGDADTGGLVGLNNGAIGQSHWDTGSTDQADAVGDQNGTTAQISAIPAGGRYNHASYGQLGVWENLYGDVWVAKDGANNPTWVMIEGSTRPFLYSEWSTTIRNTHQLQLMALDLGADYTLAFDIDASETAGANASGMWSTAGFSPVGNNVTNTDATRFTGTLDGRGHVIDGLTIDRDTQDYIGLFGYAATSATIRNLGLVGGSVTGNDFTGSLVGWNLGNIVHSYTTNIVSGDRTVGGLVGMNGNTSRITESHATGEVTGVASVGGLVGDNIAGLISASYATGDVVGIGESSGGLGGLAGVNRNGGVITQSYATGDVSGRGAVGGLVGVHAGGSSSISQSYASGNVSGASEVGGLVGASSPAAITDSYYLLVDDRSIEASGGMANLAGGVRQETGVAGKTLTVTAATRVELPADIELADNHLLVQAGADLDVGVAINASTLTLESGGDITLEAGASLTVGGAGDALVLAAADAFINEAGASAVETTHADGRWLIYSDNPDDNTFGGLVSGSNAVWNSAYGDAVPAMGNRYVFTGQFGELTVVGTFDDTKIYGEDYAAPALVAGTHYTLTGFVNAADYGNVFEQDSAANIGLTGAPAVSLAGTDATANAGDYDFTWNNGDLANTAGYTFTAPTDGGTLTVERRAITVTADADQTKVYGDADPASYAYTVGGLGLVNGDTLSGALTRDAGENAGTYAITQGGVTDANNANYTITFAGADFTITPRAITVSAGSGTSIYGNAAANPGISLTAGTLAFNDTLELLGLGNDFAITDTTGVGTYDIAVTSAGANANYTIHTEDGQWSVTPRAITVTAGAGQTKIYGDADPLAFTYTVGGLGLVNDDTLSGALSREAGENAGTYAITQGDLTDGSGNYAITFAGADFTITPRAITVTAGSGASIYGNAAANPGISLTAGTLAFNDTLDSLGLGNDFAITGATGVGTYDIAVTGANANYSITTVDGEWTVTPRAITVTAHADQTKVYGDADPLAFTYTVGGLGLVNGDTLSGALDREAGENAGTYAITQGGVTDANNANYAITFEGADFTITPRVITVTAGSGASIYGNAAANPGISLTAGTLAFNDTLDTLGLGNDFAITGSTGVGTYDIAVTGANANYSITTVDGEWTVTPRDLIVRANDVAKRFGVQHVFLGDEFTTEGLVNDDEVLSATLASAGAARTAGLAGSPYEITIQNAIGEGLENYTITYVSGELTIVNDPVAGGETFAWFQAGLAGEDITPQSFENDGSQGFAFSPTRIHPGALLHISGADVE